MTIKSGHLEMALRESRKERDALHETIERLTKEKVKAQAAGNAWQGCAKSLSAQLAKAREALEQIAFTSLLTGAQARDIAVTAIGEQIAVEVPNDDDGRQADTVRNRS